MNTKGTSLAATAANSSTAPAQLVSIAQLPELAELQSLARVVSLPLKTRFRGVRHREIMLFEGPYGWAEFAPFLEYAPQEAATWLAAAINHGWTPAPKILRKMIAVNATLPAVSPSDVPQVLASFPGATTVKIKVAERGQKLADDIARVLAAAKWFRRQHGQTASNTSKSQAAPATDFAPTHSTDPTNTQLKIRLDANGAWSVSQALTAIQKITALTHHGFALDYVEQPCKSVTELAELRLALQKHSLAVRIAADESVRKAQDPLLVAKAEAADLLVIKAAPLGGAARALEIVQQAGLPAVVSSALDSSVGISAGLELAASLPAELFGGACGLGTAALLAADVTSQPLFPQAGLLPVGRVAPQKSLLDKYAANAERQLWWQQRLTACYRKLTAA